ncbi:MAG: hypothetical protein ACYCSP_03390 [Acidobacteriaceae bacterium]
MSRFRAMDADKRRQLGYRLIDRIDEYFSSLKDRPAQRSAQRSAQRHHIDALATRLQRAAKTVLERFFGAAHSF